MSFVIEQRAPAVDTVLGDTEEEVLWVHVFINHV
jgi:hypothetical protein